VGKEIFGGLKLNENSKEMTYWFLQPNR
jgi:hypothetical protein